jgi:hypothetical protein
MTSINRRKFFHQSAGIGVAVAASRVRAKSLDEKLNLGFIGLGGRGNELLGLFGSLPEVRVAALCDPDQKHLETTASKHTDAKKHRDLRQLLDDRDVDAVVIATCNHWHALAAIWACQAGKDVYVEKPLAHNHWEAQQVVHAARKYDRIVQIGTQQRSDPLQRELKEFLHDQQALGTIKYAQVCRFGKREPIGKRTTPLRPPENLDYNLWLGPASDQPIYRDKLHYDWHWDWNTGNGEMGNWGVHVMDDAINVVLRDRVAFPKRIAAAGGRVLWSDAGQTPNVCFAYYDTGSVPIFFALSNLASSTSHGDLSYRGVGSGYVVQCEGGYYAGGRGSGAAYDRGGHMIRRFTGDSGAGHQRNFVTAVHARDRSLLNAEVEIGHRSTAWCNLTDVAIRVGGPYSHDEAASIGQPPQPWNEIIELLERESAMASADFATHLHLSPVLEFDAATEQFSGKHAVEVNRLLHREYRQPFEVHAVV